MAQQPEFPNLKPIELEDRQRIQECLSDYRPEISELTFTNFFIWRHHYDFQWALMDDLLVFIAHDGGEHFCAFGPVGDGPRVDAAREVLNWLREEKGVSRPRIERAPERLVAQIEEAGGFSIEPQRDHFDYVYLTEKLVELSGNKLHSQRGHVKRFKRKHDFEYTRISEDNADACRQVLTAWAEALKCYENPSIRAECHAVHEALDYYEALELTGGRIVADGEPLAFAVGEQLNPDAAVIHIEKGMPGERDVYAAINQQFCEHEWQDFEFINREQDLGEPHLRRAKKSYNPERMVKKFLVTLE